MCQCKTMKIENAVYLLLFTVHIQSNNRINSWDCPMCGVCVCVLFFFFFLARIDRFVLFRFISILNSTSICLAFMCAPLFSLFVFLFCFFHSSIGNWSRQFCRHLAHSVCNAQQEHFFVWPLFVTCKIVGCHLKVVDHCENGLFAHNI